MSCYVDIYRTESIKVQKHLLREELTQSLGLAKDSPLYQNSIFQSSYSVQVTEYAKIDKQLIQLLYHPEMKTGLNKKEAEETLIEIVPDIIPG